MGDPDDYRHHFNVFELIRRTRGGSLLVGCMSGAASIDRLESVLQRAGFETIHIRPKDESKQFIREWAPGSKMEDYVVSATIEAIKSMA